MCLCILVIAKGLELMICVLRWRDIQVFQVQNRSYDDNDADDDNTFLCKKNISCFFVFVKYFLWSVDMEFIDDVVY